MVEKGEALTPLEERRIEFYGDFITAAVIEVGGKQEILVPLRPICENLGLTWSSQFMRVQRDSILSEAIQGVLIMRTPENRGGVQEMLCLPIDLVPGWLFGVNETRVKAELKDKILRYKRECFRVLWDAFKGDVMGAAQLPTSTPQSGAAYAFELATGVQALARNQLEMEKRIEQIDGRQDAMGGFMRPFIQNTNQHLRDNDAHLRDNDERLNNLELHIQGNKTINDAQATEIFLIIREIGRSMGAKGQKGGYGKIYDKLYTRYRIHSYKNLPADKYDEAMAWLSEELNKVNDGPKDEQGKLF